MKLILVLFLFLSGCYSTGGYYYHPSTGYYNYYRAYPFRYVNKYGIVKHRYSIRNKYRNRHNSFFGRSKHNSFSGRSKHNSFSGRSKHNSFSGRQRSGRNRHNSFSGRNRR